MEEWAAPSKGSAGAFRDAESTRVESNAITCILGIDGLAFRKDFGRGGTAGCLVVTTTSASVAVGKIGAGSEGATGLVRRSFASHTRTSCDVGHATRADTPEVGTVRFRCGSVEQCTRT